MLISTKYDYRYNKKRLNYLFVTQQFYFSQQLSRTFVLAYKFFFYIYLLYFLNIFWFFQEKHADSNLGKSQILLYFEEKYGL